MFTVGLTLTRSKKRKTKKAKTEFSKKILVVAGITNAIVIIFTLVMVWRTSDLSPLAYLIPSVAAEVATGTGFYYAKAKVENRIKLMKSNDIPLNDETFNNSEV